MLRRCTIAVVALSCFAGIALAQGAKVGGVARQAAMGGSNIINGVVYNPYITEDPVLLLINPAYQGRYSNYAWWNVGGGTLAGLSTGDNGYQNQNVGVSFGLTRDITLGAVFNYDPTGVNSMRTLLTGGNIMGFAAPAWFNNRAHTTINPVQNVWEVLGAFRLGGIDLGAGFMYGSSDNDTKNSNNPVGGTATSSETDGAAHMFGFRVGMLMDLGTGSNLDAHGAIRFDKASDVTKVSPSTATTPLLPGEYSASATEIELGVRLKMRMSNRFNFVPYASFTTVSAEPKIDAEPTNAAGAPIHRTDTEKLSFTGLAVGAGMEYKVNNFYFAGGVSYQMTRGKAELSNGLSPASTNTLTSTYSSLPTFNLGAEWWLTDWLAARGGYFRAMGWPGSGSKNESSNPGGSATTENTTTSPTSGISFGGLTPANYDGNVTLGLGLRFGSFSLDATMSEEALRRGLGIIGSNDNINTFGYLTMSYNFE